MRTAVIGCVALAAVGTAGCESTQAKSARLESQAKARPGEEGLAVKQADEDVQVVGKPTLLSDENGTALVVTLRNRSKRALANVPLGVELTDGREPVYRNDTPGIERGLVSAALLAGDAETLWVNDQITPTGKPKAAEVVAGVGGKPVKGKPPRIVVTKVAITDDPTSGLAASGRVVNRSKVEQRDLVVTVVARKGAKPVAAGRAVVRRLRANAGTSFTAFLIGDARGARPEAVAPPTTLR